ncbi:MAG: restriction endonuclease [archaeon]|nr:restriction endonuclease [archaeon]
MSEKIKEQTLKDIVEDYLSKKYLYENLQKTPVSGNSGQKWNFDGLVKTNDSTFGVFIKDWNRSIGVNQVRLLEKACLDMGFQGGLIIGNYFSSHAKSYGKTKGVQIVTKSELIYKSKYS